MGKPDAANPHCSAFSGTRTQGSETSQYLEEEKTNYFVFSLILAVRLKIADVLREQNRQ